MASKSPLWTGVAVALVTLFDEGDELDAEATATHAHRLVELGVRAVLVAGTTGEADALTDGERFELVTAVRSACPEVPVIAGVSGQWWRPAVEQATAVLAAGADALLIAPPRRSTDLVDFYGHVASAAAGRAVLAYHYPGVAGGEVPIEQLKALPIDGIKDSTGDPERLLQELDICPGAVYTGSAVLLGYAASLGATGAILAAANAVPEDCVAAWNGDSAAQRRLLSAHLAGKAEFPRGLKRLVAERFGTPTHYRLGGV